MVTLALPGLLRGAGRRASAVTARNVAALRSSYLLVLVSGFFEPLLYLLSIGVGVGALVGEVPVGGGRTVSYAAFVAPSMLAASAMSGAMAEVSFNFFGKMKYMRLYDGVLATPVKPFEIALGELMWAMMRGALYSAAFLAIMVGMDLTSAGWALAAFPATLLVGFAFGAAGMTMSTYMRSWQDFDYVFTAQFALFLLSGTFAPVSAYPLAVQALIAVTPLYHAVELVRGLTLGDTGWPLVAHTAYLLAMTIGGLLLAGRRMGKLLYK